MEFDLSELTHCAQAAHLEPEQLRELLFKLHEGAAKAESVEEVLSTVLDALSAFLRVDVVIASFFETDGTAQVKIARGVSGSFLHKLHAFSPWDKGEMNAEPFFITELDAEPRVRPILETLQQENVQALLFVPICCKRGVVSQVAVFFRENCSVSNDQLVLAKAISQRVAGAIARTQMDHRVFVDAAANRSLLEATDHALAILGRDGRILAMNSAASELSNFLCGTNDMLGTSIYDLPREDLISQVSDRFQRCLAGEKITIEMTYQAYAGENERSFLSSYTPVYDQQQNVSGVLVSLVETTDVWHAQRQMRIALERLNHISNATRDALYEWEVHEDRTWVSDEYVKTYGQSQRYADWLSKIHPADVARVQQYSEQILNSDKSHYAVEYQFKRLDGDYAHVYDRATVLRDENSKAIRAVGSLTDLTQLKQTQLESQINEKRFSALFENLVAGSVIWGEDERIIASNRAFRTMVGYSEEELANKKLVDLVHPDEYQQSLQVFANAFKHKQSEILTERRLIDRFGRTVHTRLSATVLEDAGTGERVSVAVYEDKTETVRGKIALGETKARYESLLQGLGSVVAYETNPDHPFVSKSIESVIGITRSEFLSKHALIAELMPPAEWESRKREIAAWLSSETPTSLSLQYQVLKPDGTTAWIEDRMGRATAENGARYITGLAMDVTERRNMEIELARANRLDSLGRLAGGVAHDFNNLLAAIVGYSELAEKKLSRGQSVAEEIEKTLIAANKAAGLTQQLLAFARRQGASPSPISIAAILQDMSGILGSLLGDSITLRIETPPKDADAWLVNIDPVQVEQLLMNFALNARDAMPDGGVFKINVEHRSTDWNPGEEAKLDEFVQITLGDTGVGMDKCTLEHAFDPFYTTKDIGKGTGLGLAVCYGIVQQAGGSIRMESEQGKGTTFEITLPRLRETPARASSTPTVACRPKKSRGSALVVEDERSVREVLCHQLRELGFSVVEAIDGVDALKVLDRIGPELELVVSDLVMPRMSGKEFVSRVRSAYPEVRLVMVSGAYAETEFGNALCVADGYLRKPFTAADLAEIVGADGRE